MNKTKIAASILTSLTLSGFVLIGIGHAEDQWQRDHQGRAEVNQRLENQDRRINRDVRDGEMSPREAQQLHAEDQGIHNQEREDAAVNHGHLTGAERHQLNREENSENRQIHQDERY